MMTNSSQTDSARPLKKRHYPYRLPLGAFACILLWFLAMFTNVFSDDEKAISEVNWEADTALSVSDEPFKVYDFQAELEHRQMDQIHDEVKSAIHYYALVARQHNKPLAEAHIILPEAYPYDFFVQLNKISQAEGLHLAVGKDQKLILRTRK